MGPLSVLGSTGSIGTQTLRVAEKLGLRVAALSGNRNTVLLERQARQWSPEVVAIADGAAFRDLRVRLADTSCRVAGGAAGLEEVASLESAGTVVTGIVGTAGLAPTLAAIDAGKRIALANKETLVCAGGIVMSRAKERGAEIIPVDSEHSAIFQCMDNRAGVRPSGIILTASGGPFRGMKADELKSVTPERAVKNPNWDMGAKVTVDSATLMNKGLEFIEAMHLFSLSPDQIRILVHPQSVVHSMVEYEDGSVIAQMAVPDMCLPIQYAITYPRRLPSPAAALDLTSSALTFEEPDTDTFRCLPLAVAAARTGGTAGAVLSAANEEAVRLFLDGRLDFPGIYEAVAAAMESVATVPSPSLDDILLADRAARESVLGSV